MKERLLALAAIGEGITGVSLLVVPSIVSWLLLGAELTGVSIPIARVAGIALIGLGIGCWPSCTALCGMLTYSMLVTLYLGFAALSGSFVGILLWPAVGLHALLTLLLGRVWFTSRKTS